MGRERRRRTRRSTAPRSTGQAAPTPGMEPLADEPLGAAPSRTSTRRAAAPAPHTVTQVRSDRVMARESAMMIAEMKRVMLVSGVCFGMLAVLVVVERLQG